MNLQERNQLIIEAIKEKAEKICPGSLAIIGINGSFMTGDYYEKSDLDLLLLINDDNGWKLGETLIQDDLQVGHDLYCTKWNRLEEDACYTHPNISKLMDAKIVYYADERDLQRLNKLREKVHSILSAPFCKEDWDKADRFVKDAEHCYTEAMTTEEAAKVRVQAGDVIYNIVNALAMLNKTYFKRSVKRTYEELANMEKKPEHICVMIEDVIVAETVNQVREKLTVLMKAVKCVMRQEEIPAAPGKKADKENLRATYEEMCSNWRNKMHHAVTLQNRYLSYMSMNSFQGMLDEIKEEVELPDYQVFEGYVPGDLEQMAAAFEHTLEEYRKQYDNVGLEVNHYPDINTFIKSYLK